MRGVTRQLNNPRRNTAVNPNNVWWLQNSWTKFGLPRNSYTDCMNIIIWDRGKFKRRRTANQLWVEPDSSIARIHWVWYSHLYGWIRVKGTNIQTLTNENATWNTIASFPVLSSWSEVQFLNFRATEIWGTIVNGTTAEDDNERYIFTTTNDMLPNIHTGKYLKIGGEIKMIVGNENNIIYIQGKFQEKYSSGTSYQIINQIDAVYIVSPGQSIRVWRWWSSIEVLSLAINIDRAAVQSYGANNNLWRLMGISLTGDQKVYISEMGTGEFFAKDSFIPLSLNGDLRHISENRGQITVYSEYGRATIAGDNPDNYYIKESQSYKGCIAPSSVAQWTNLELYLSHEGIEYMQALQEATLTEGMSRSDSIVKLFERHEDFTRARGAISDWRYYLSIEDMVYIYDFERSVKFQKPIYTVAQYTECSTASTWYEWTYAGEVQGQIVFAQGARVYRITDERIWQNVLQSPLLYWIEFPIEHFWEYRLDKAVQKMCTYFQKNPSLSLESVRTRFSVYIRYDEWEYEKMYEADNLFEIETYLGQRCNNMQVRIEIQDMESTVDDSIEFQENVIYFSWYGKN